tara:strand:+ start:163 stop:1365 length:1203 start_codon:yes stop_codon:yes gene_type:complete
MKKILFFVLLIFVGCSQPEPQNFQQLVLRDDLYYLKDTNEVFNGPVFNVDGKSETYIKNGKFNGSYISYHDNGQIKEKFTYKNNLVHGDYSSFFDNGQIMEEYFFKNGILEGNPKVYYNNGQIFQEFIFNKESESSFSMYYPNGQQLTSFNFLGSLDFDDINEIEGINRTSEIFDSVTFDSVVENIYNDDDFFEEVYLTFIENSFINLLTINQEVPFYLDNGNLFFRISNGEFEVIKVFLDILNGFFERGETPVTYFYKGLLVEREVIEFNEEDNQERIKKGWEKLDKVIYYTFNPTDFPYSYWKHGPYTTFFGDGSQQTKYYILNKKQSNLTVIFENGQRQEIEKLNDNEEEVVIYFTNGGIQKGLMVNRKFEGITTYTYPNGKIIEEEYKNGVKVSSN